MALKLFPKFVEINNKEIQNPPKKEIKSEQQKFVDLSSDSNVFLNVTATIFILLTIQFALAIGSYSGKGNSPMFGDFEAQRHWMEITYNLPIDQWYLNSTSNNLLYWGLDYPPLTAYHHYFLGIISAKINPNWIKLNDSRGYETENHKLFMRISAIIPFFIFYLPPIIYFFSKLIQNKSNENNSSIFMAFAILYPGLLVIDNAHFQYNSISLGLFLISYCFLVSERYFTGSIFFISALNYKQMELYHSLPIFVYILSRSIKKPVIQNFSSSVFQISKIGFVVITTFLLIWFPFILTETFKDVLIRIFPFNRGIYEDKVASFWCAFSFILKRLPIQNFLVYLSTLFVLSFSIPSLSMLFLKPSTKNFRLSLFATSLSFFLFSFHVHEKTILLVSICAILILPDYPSDTIWFLNISCISLFSLCVKDDNSIVLMIFGAYFASSIIFWCCFEDSPISNILKMLSILTGLTICFIELFGPIPERLPHIYQLANAFYCCIHFMYFLFLFTYRMWDLSFKGKKSKIE